MKKRLYINYKKSIMYQKEAFVFSIIKDEG